MGKLLLVHWNATEAEELAAPLRAGGWGVEIEAQDGARVTRRVREGSPDAGVIYLTRLPSHGRETADGLRGAKATRGVPIVFVGGTEEAIQKTRAKVPDASFVTSAQLPGVLAVLPKIGREVDGPSSPQPLGFRRFSEEAVRSRTGKGWEEWFAILDAWDTGAKGHARSAKYLLEVHGVSPWWSQAVAIRYEWERGLRS